MARPQRGPIWIDLQHIAQIFRAVEDQGSIDRLAALAGAFAARQDRDAALARDRHRGRDILDRARHENADRLDLVAGSWLNLVEGFFSKLARSVLRNTRVASKGELKDRIMAAMDHFNRDSVVHTWSYKLDQAA
jgi:hypothetical protein